MVTNIATKFTLLHPLVNKTAAAIASAFYGVICDFGFPKIVQSDNSSKLVNKTMATIKAALIKLAKSALMKLVSSDWSHWSTFLLATQFVINQRLTFRHKSTPFELFLGHLVNLPSDFSNIDSNPFLEADHLAHIVKLHSVVWPTASGATDLYNQIVSVTHDSSVSLAEFKLGNTVMLHLSATTSVMDPKYLGPFSVKYMSQPSLGTRCGAYILVDVTGNELEDRIPPSLLKLVPSFPSGSSILLSSTLALPDKTDLESQANPDSSDNDNSESNNDNDDSSKFYKVSKVLNHCGPANC
ncbi:hypothetical protein QOT17_007073 [Balamuthia mandrillaris]